jgi:hypothetical protein
VVGHQNHRLFKGIAPLNGQWQPITTFSVTNLQIIAAEATVEVFSRHISSTTSTPGLSVSKTYLLTMNQMAQIWCSTTLVQSGPRIEYLWPGTWSSVDWQIGWAFRSLPAVSRVMFSNLFVIELTIILNTELVFA